MVLSRATRPIAQRAVSMSATRAAVDTKSDSFAFGIMQGKVNPQHIFPYPSTLTEDETEMLEAMVDPFESFFANENDALHNDEICDVPEPILEGLKEMGTMGILVPEDYEGLGLNNTQYARLSEVMGRHDLGIGIVVGAHQSIGYKAILLCGNDEQKEKYLPDLATGRKMAAFALTEPGSGSDAASIKTQAVLSEDGKTFHLTGGKVWISNGGFADVFTVFCKVPEKQEDGTVKDKMAALIVERAFGGVTNGPPEKKMGIKCSNTAEVYFDNTPVPVENLLKDVGDGFKVAMEVLNNGRFGMSSCLAGTQGYLIERAADFALNRHQFTDKIYKYGAIQEKLARMSAEHYATESIAYLISQAMDNKAENYHLEAAIGKIFASERAWHCADECIQIMGGMGFMAQQGVEKVMRDLRIFRIFEGTNDILRLMIALQGMQVQGKVLKADKMLAIKAKVHDIFGTGAGEASGQIAKLADSSLSEEAKNVEEQINAFHALSINLLVKHQKKIMSRQFELKRVADCMIDLYAASACISRASTAKAQNKNNWEMEIELAKTFVHEAVTRTKNNIADVKSAESHYERMAKIGQKIAEAEGPVHSHPIC